MADVIDIPNASRALAGGGVIAYPTEGVFGLGCDPVNERAVQRLLALKSRPSGKGLILLAGSMDQLRPFVATVDPRLHAQLRATWPGPVTWILPARTGVPDWLTGGRDTIAVRVTAHPVARALCLRCHTALVSTSANVAGRPPARSICAVRLQFDGHLDYIVRGALGGLAGPTEIRDGRTGAVLRPGTASAPGA